MTKLLKTPQSARDAIATYTLNALIRRFRNLLEDHATLAALTYQEGYLAALAYRSPSDCPYPAVSAPTTRALMAMAHRRIWFAGYDAATARCERHKPDLPTPENTPARHYRKAH